MTVMTVCITAMTVCITAMPNIQAYSAGLLVHSYLATHRWRNINLSRGSPQTPFIHDNSFDLKTTVPKDFLTWLASYSNNIIIIFFVSL